MYTVTACQKKKKKKTGDKLSTRDKNKPAIRDYKSLYTTSFQPHKMKAQKRRSSDFFLDKGKRKELACPVTDKSKV